MRIERLNENQIRCSLDKEDMEEYKIFNEEVYRNPLLIKNLLEQILIEAKLTVGFDVDSNGVNIESNYKSNELVFIFTKNNSNPMLSDEYNSDIRVYRIKDFDTLRLMAKTLKNTHLGKNSLYTNEDNSEIYLLFKLHKMSIFDFNKLSNLIDEFGVRIFDEKSEKFYDEHYYLRIKGNALLKISQIN